MAVQKQLQTLRKRELGEIIGDAFKVFFRNFKGYSFGFLVFVMPIFLVLGFVIVAFGSNMLARIMENDVVAMMGDIAGLVKGMGVLYLGLFVCYMSVYTMVLTGLKAYRENGDEPFSFEELKRNFLTYLMPVAVTYIAISVVIILLAFGSALILGLISPLLIGLGVLFIIPLVIYIAVVTSLMPIIRIEEELSLMESYQRSKYLIKDNWWSTFGVVMIAAIVAGLLAPLFNLPYLIFTATATFGGIGGEEGLQGVSMMLALSYLLGILGGLFTSIYTQIAIGLKYYDLVEKKENVGLLDKIGSLGQTGESFFENEGEY